MLSMKKFFGRQDDDEGGALPPLAKAANTPASVFEEAAAGFAEIYGSSMVREQRWFIVTTLCVLLAISTVAAIALLLPLKQVRPYVVEVNPGTGMVNRPVEVLNVDPSLAVIKSELARWTEAMYTLDPLRTREAQRWATERVADKAVGQAAEFRARERVYERITREPDLVREAKVAAVDASQKGTAFVFVTTTERVGAGTPTGEQIKRYRLTINYKLLPPTDEAKLIANPLGLYVTFFSDVEERSK